MTIRRGVVIASAVALLVGAGGVGLAVYLMPRAHSQMPHSHPVTAAHVTAEGNDDEPAPPDEEAVVKTIHPKRDKNFTVTFQQLAIVRPYYQVDLRARASGVIDYLPKDIGARVTQGELLVEIDVPDVRQEVAQKEAVIEQRRQELLVSKAQLKTAMAYIELAQAAIEMSHARVASTFSSREMHDLRYHRFQDLLREKGVQPVIVEEEKRDFDAAQANWQEAQAAVKKAVAELHEKEASLLAAQTDITLKESLVRVAERERDRSQALADYARLTAPFDGVIVERDVDLGTFVQNATSSAGKPLLTVARTDIVTAGMKVPDYIAPFVSRDTKVLLQLDQMPGVQLEGRVTRFAPNIVSGDRTMQVEADLFNRGAVAYGKFLGQYFGCKMSVLGAISPIESLTLAGAGRDQLGPRLRSVTDPLPIPPLVRNGVAEPPRLLPGMSGHMTLLLQRFANAYLLPSSAVFTRGGKPFIEVVNEGKIEVLPVHVQVNDGRLAKIAVIARAANGRTGETEIWRELTGKEEVVAGRQSEVQEGQAVHAVNEDWD